MSFDSLQHAAAKQQIKLLGGVLASLQTPTDTIAPVWVMVERNVAVPSDNGLNIENRIVASLLVAEVGELSRGHRIITAAASFTVSDVMEDDGFVVRVFVRG